MVTVNPETATSAELPGDQDQELPFVGELRLNLSALGVDHHAEDFGERLCQLSRITRLGSLSIPQQGN
jgi:hypothetical protein